VTTEIAVATHRNLLSLQITFPSTAKKETTMEAVRERKPLLSDSNSRSGQARDPEELEGTLLLPTILPTALAVPDNQHDNSIPMASTAATVLPTTYFEYDTALADEAEKQEEIVVEEAVALPSHDEFAHDPHRDSNTLAHAQRKGLIQTDDESEKIKRANRETFSLNYQNKQQIKDANSLANATKRKEELGLLQTSATIPKEMYTPPATVKAPEFYEGSYGKEYEIQDYDTAEYETTDYETTEYKSVYDS
jgi:hypothetical protein